MIRDVQFYRWAAVGMWLLGTALSVLSVWLILTNVLLSAYGFVASLAGGAVIQWDGIFPVLASQERAALSVAAGVLLGLLASAVQVLVWRDIIDWDQMGMLSRATVASVVVYDILSTIWGLTGGVFYSPEEGGASLVRLVMSIALTLFAFSVGAERWLVMGMTLVTRYGDEAMVTLGWKPRPKHPKQPHPDHAGPPEGKHVAIQFPPNMPPQERQAWLQRQKQKAANQRQREAAESRNREMIRQ